MKDRILLFVLIAAWILVPLVNGDAVPSAVRIVGGPHIHTEHSQYGQYMEIPIEGFDFTASGSVNLTILNSSGAIVFNTTLTALPNGSFVVVWNSSNNNFGEYTIRGYDLGSSIITLLKIKIMPYYTFSGKIINSSNGITNSNVYLYDENSTLVAIDDAVYTFNLSYNVEYDIVIVPDNVNGLKKIIVHVIENQGPLGDILGIDDTPENNSNFTSFQVLIGIYPILSKYQYMNVTLTHSSGATGVFKCIGWDFYNRHCINDSAWTRIVNTTGTETTITLFSGDPGIGIDGSPAFCGDGACNGAETCNSCPADCGECSKPKCDPSWVCTAWSPAVCPISEIQTRTCADEEGCGTTEGKPDETQSCTYIPTCSDGIKNGGEDGVDCGGSCPACPECEKNSDCPENYECKNKKCEPIQEEKPYEKPIDKDKVDIQTGISCEEGIIVKEETRDIDFRDYSISELGNLINIPEGYSLAVPPFRLDCEAGASTTLRIAVPDNMVDIKALKCSGGVCGVATVRETTTVGCRDKATDTVKKEEILEVGAMPVKIEPVKEELTGEKRTASAGDYNIEFLSDTEGAVSLGMPTESLQQPKNSNVRIVGTPLVIKIADIRNISSESKMVKITVPYTENGTEDQSIALYAKIMDGNATKWSYIGGNVSRQEKTITALVDLSEYAVNDEITIAPLGTYCPFCHSTRFENEFTPVPDSRNAVLLVHGLFSTSTTWEDAVNDIRMTNQPFQLWTFSYPSWKSPVENGKDLANFLDAYGYRFDNIYIIGHSLGGLVTEQALAYAYNLNRKDEDEYEFINNVRKVILVGVPHDGSPVAKYLKLLIDEHINEDTEGTYTLSPEGFEALKEGMRAQKVPGIEYNVIAGTMSYNFIDLTNLYFNGEINDGLVSLSSAQHVGEGYINKECENFWARNVTHTYLNDDPVTRRIIEQIIAKSAKEQLRSEDFRKAVLGYTNYFELNVENCSPDDLYIIIGRTVKENETSNPLLCGCGNGVCMGLETKENCPQDCAIVERPAFRRGYCWLSVLLLLIMLLLVLVSLYREINKKKPKNPKTVCRIYVPRHKLRR